jgi:tetrahydromethanopterin S-methyltransferase subunit D
VVGTIVFVGGLLCALLGGIAGWSLRDYFAERDQER